MTEREELAAKLREVYAKAIVDDEPLALADWVLERERALDCSCNPTCCRCAKRCGDTGAHGRGHDDEGRGERCGADYLATGVKAGCPCVLAAENVKLRAAVRTLDNRLSRIQARDRERVDYRDDMIYRARNEHAEAIALSKEGK